MTTGWCCKCKKKQEILNGKESKTKRGVTMLKGKCKCGCTMCRMMGK